MSFVDTKRTRFYVCKDLQCDWSRISLIYVGLATLPCTVASSGFGSCASVSESAGPRRGRKHSLGWCAFARGRDKMRLQSQPRRLSSVVVGGGGLRGSRGSRGLLGRVRFRALLRTHAATWKTRLIDSAALQGHVPRARFEKRVASLVDAPHSARFGRCVMGFVPAFAENRHVLWLACAMGLT